MDQHDVFRQFVEGLSGGIEERGDIEDFSPTGAVYYRGDLMMEFRLHAFSLDATSPHINNEVSRLVGQAVRSTYEDEEFDLVCIALPGFATASNPSSGKSFSRVPVIGFFGRTKQGTLLSAIVGFDQTGNRLTIHASDNNQIMMNQFATFFEGFFND